MKPKLVEVTNLVSVVDELGSINETISALTEKAKMLKGVIIDSGADSLAGDKYTASVVHADRNSTDWKSICKKLKASRQMITANTVMKHVVSVRVS